MTDIADKPAALPLPVEPQKHGVTVHVETMVDKDDPGHGLVLFVLRRPDGKGAKIGLKVPALAAAQLEEAAKAEGLPPKRYTLPELIGSLQKLTADLQRMQASYDKECGPRILLADVNAPGFRGFKGGNHH
jgi:hypothetical protein